MLHCSASACGRGSGLELRLGRVSLSGEPERGEPERGRLERGELEREGGRQLRGEADSGVVRELRSAGIGVMCGWGNGGLKWSTRRVRQHSTPFLSSVCDSAQRITRHARLCNRLAG